MSILAVVDMQPGYSASKACLANVIELVAKSMRHSLPILVIELNPESCKETYPEITDLLKGYRKYSKITKISDDGSLEFKDFIESDPLGQKVNLDKIRVCGVNANCCVRATALGLDKKYEQSKIIVHYEACCGTSGNMNQSFRDNDWHWFVRSNDQKNLFICKEGRIYHPLHKSIQVGAA